ncbi:MAG: ArsA family ATPase [Thermoleophilia bacterium]
MPTAPPAPTPPVAERRLCFVLGKGGVGKSTVAAALALSLARDGHRTLLIEVAAQQRVSALFGDAAIGHAAPTELAPGLFAISIDPEHATEDYLVSQLHVRPLVEMLTHSRAFHNFAAAAPGLSELVTVGKIWSLAVALREGGDAPVWDRLVVDCPATGHGLALLETAGNVEELAASGPIRDQARRIQQVITHPAATGVMVVARPQELPVSEAAEATAHLRRHGLPVAAAVMNGMGARRFGPDDEAPLRAAAAGSADDVRAAAGLALAHLDRQRAEDAYARRLAAETGLPVTVLPRIVRPMDRDALAVLADALGEGVPAREPAT